MKGIFKLTTAALALVTLASCSNEELFGEKAQIGMNAQNGIKVEVEGMVNPVTTRAAYVPSETGSKGTLYWQAGDEIQVFDETLVKYDKYAFDKDAAAFVLTGKETTNIGEPKFALFAGKKDDGKTSEIESHNWVYENDAVVAEFNIRPDWKWAEDDKTLDGTLAFMSNLPLWGTAEADDEYGVSVALKYLTGIFRIDLANVPNNAAEVIVEGFTNQAGTAKANMTGKFKVTIAKGGKNEENAQLDYTTASTSGQNTITVDITGAKKEKTTVFVPIIAQKYGLLKFYYTETKGGTKKLIKSVKNLTVKRQNFYKLTVDAFETSGSTPSAINTALELNAEEAEDVIIKTSQVTTSSAKDYTIKIPEMSTKSITLDLKGLITTASSNHLEIESEADYAGDLIIDLGDATTVTNLSNVYVNLPNANVTFIGSKLNSTVIGAAAAGKPVADKLIVKTLNIANSASEDDAKTTVSGIYMNAESNDGVTEAGVLVAEDATVNNIVLEDNANTKNVTVNGTVGTVNAAVKDGNGKEIAIPVTVGPKAIITSLLTYADVELTGNAKVGEIGYFNSASDNLYAGKVTIDGADTKDDAGVIVTNVYANDEIKVTGKATITKISSQLSEKLEITDAAVTTVYAPKADITLSGATAISGNIVKGKTLTISGTASAAKATITGDVTISIDADQEVEAISTSLTMSEGTTFTLNGGYVKALTVLNDGEKATDVLTIKHGATAAYTAIGGITATGSYQVDKTTKSVWNGKAIGGSLDPKSTTYATDLAKLTPYSTTTTTKIFTANQLASFAATGAATLESNIDLNSLAWTMPTLKNSFTGVNLGTTTAPAYPTIANINLELTGKGSMGLFAEATATATISNITIDGVTLTTAMDAKKLIPRNIGAFVGQSSAALTFKNVTVKDATLVPQTESDFIGALVGWTPSKVTIGETGENGAKGATVTGTSLKGTRGVGGLCGQAGGAEIYKSAVTLTSIASFKTGEPGRSVTTSYDWAGSYGMLIGNSLDDVTVDAATTHNDLITSHRSDLGFMYKFKTVGSDIYYYYGNIDVKVGRFHNDGKKITINTATPTTITWSATSTNLAAGEGPTGTIAAQVANATNKPKHNIFVKGADYVNL